MYGLLLNMLGQVNTVIALQYYSLIVVISMLILLCNVLGLLPYSFTITSQLFVTFMLSISLFIGVIIIGIYRNKLNFIKFFIPSAVSNIFLKGFLIIIELLSFIIRPFSLGIRLFANMLAGHTLMFILGGFMFSVLLSNFVLCYGLPLIIIMLVVVLEISIAFIQAYVFTILLIIYINDMMNINH